MDGVCNQATKSPQAGLQISTTGFKRNARTVFDAAVFFLPRLVNSSDLEHNQLQSEHSGYSCRELTANR
jgi:hypothetical protein